MQSAHRGGSVGVAPFGKRVSPSIALISLIRLRLKVQLPRDVLQLGPPLEQLAPSRIGARDEVIQPGRHCSSRSDGVRARGVHTDSRLCQQLAQISQTFNARRLVWFG